MDDFKFELKRSQANKIPRNKIITELEKVAKKFDYTDFTQDQFNDMANISHYTVIREFGTWEKILKFLQKNLKKKGIDFEITTRRSKYSNQEIFDEMERIWRALGHRPSRNEWNASNPKISYDTAYRRFGGWTNVCLKFIEYKSDGSEITTDIDENSQDKQGIGTDAKTATNKLLTKKVKIEKTRTIPLSARLKVFVRDNFRCVFCGRSPATDIGIKLHIDHIVPFSEGGKTTLDNLQTLCQECNLGKSNRTIKNNLRKT